MAGFERFEELLVDAVTEGAPVSELELSAPAFAAAGELRFDFERAAAAIDLAFGYRRLEVPAALLERVRDQARGFVAASSAEKRPTVDSPGPLSLVEGGRAGGRWVQLLAAAALVLAILGWWPRLSLGKLRGGVQVVAESDIESDPALITLPLAGTEDPAAQGASGTLHWSPALQRGRLRLEGLAVNDPADVQYQLWIFDAARDDHYPVDGGVFDVPARGTTSVAVQARVPVRSPRLFAVTVEPAGGVVVSSRERVVLVGPVG